MKKIFLTLLLIPILAAIILLTWPEIIVNKKNILWALQRDEISKDLSWDQFEVNVENLGLLKKEIQIKTSKLCGQLNEELLDLEFCVKMADINVQIGTAQWPFIKSTQLSELRIESIKLNSWPEQPSPDKVKNNSEEQTPIKVLQSWKKFWGFPIPKLKINIEKIEFPKQLPIKNLSLELETIKDKIKLSILGARFIATQKAFELKLENWRPQHYTSLYQQSLQGLEIKKFHIKLGMKDDHIDLKSFLDFLSLNLKIKGKIPEALSPQFINDKKAVQGLLSRLQVDLDIQKIAPILNLIPENMLSKDVVGTLTQLNGNLKSELSFKKVESKLKAKLKTGAVLKHNNKKLLLDLESHPFISWQWPLQTSLLLKQLMLKTQAKLKLDSMKNHLSPKWKESFDQLPSPLNNFNGPVSASYNAKQGEKKDEVILNLKTIIKLANDDQKLHIQITPKAVFNISRKEIIKTDVLLNFTDVKLKLPDINLSQAIPQVGPDSRINIKKIQKAPQSSPQKKGGQEKTALELDLITPPDNPIKLSTNLINAPIYIDLNLEVRNGLPKGNINIRPLKTTLFKREIQLKKALITLSPKYSPTLDVEVHFPLPTYLVMIKLDGPVNEPRPLLSSTPPLPENDIVSVLLFGRPLSNLPDNEQASAANKTSQLLSQGLLSLSVLYFLSDTPIQSIGVDPETQKVSAQVGLTDKSSLQLSTQQDGTQSVGIRRSLGKGWFIDTSVQKSDLDDESEQKNYGVLLERIISY